MIALSVGALLWFPFSKHKWKLKPKLGLYFLALNFLSLQCSLLHVTAMALNFEDCEHTSL